LAAAERDEPEGDFAHDLPDLAPSQGLPGAGLLEHLRGPVRALLSATPEEPGERVLCHPCSSRWTSPQHVLSVLKVCKLMGFRDSIIADMTRREKSVDVSNASRYSRPRRRSQQERFRWQSGPDAKQRSS